MTNYRRKKPKSDWALDGPGTLAGVSTLLIAWITVMTAIFPQPYDDDWLFYTILATVASCWFLIFVPILYVIARIQGFSNREIWEFNSLSFKDLAKVSCFCIPTIAFCRYMIYKADTSGEWGQYWLSLLIPIAVFYIYLQISIKRFERATENEADEDVELMEGGNNNDD
jgi:hypothetical protein